MPVTTRSQAHPLTDISNESSKVVSSGSAIILSDISSVPVSIYPNNNFAGNISSIIPSTTGLPLDGECSESSHCPWNSSISKFENLEISNHVSNVATARYYHNLSVLKTCIMEADCEDSLKMSSTSQGIMDMNSLFEAMSIKLTFEITKISRDFQHVVDAHDTFKQEVRDELDELRRLVLQQTPVIGNPTVPLTPIQSSISTSVLPKVSSTTVAPGSNFPVMSSGNTQDIQSKMMLMMMKSFSKLTTAFSESNLETKHDWPKFSGESKKFHSWYLGIMMQISLPPWSELYDASKHDIVASTTNASLNGKLYSKLILALEGVAYKNFVSRKHLHANGIHLLQELVQTYKPKNVPKIIAAKMVEFWGSMKHLPTESIDSYYDGFKRPWKTERMPMNPLLLRLL
jgi:hypothetical protein